MPTTALPRPLDRITSDEFLREYGFRITARPAGQEAVWERCGWHYSETEAFARAVKEDRLRRDAEARNKK